MGPALLVSADRRRLVRRALVCFGAVGVAYLPWLPTLLGQLSQTGAPWAYTPTARELVGEISALVRDERVLGPLVLAGLGGLAPLLRRPTSVDGAAAWVLGCFAAAPIAVGWAFAHVEPSWATRYLAVVIGPLILAVGAGMARAGGMGLGALGIALLLWVQPLARLETGITIPQAHKSNAKALAGQMQAHLRAGDLVLVAQPEAVPLFSHYLETDAGFADLIGKRPRAGLMDWRNADQRLGAASSAAALQGIVDSIPPGGRLALVLPASRVVRTDTEWIRRFHALGMRAQRALAADPQFDRLRVKPLTSTRRESSASTFRFVLYERRGDPAETNSPEGRADEQLVAPVARR